MREAYERVLSKRINEIKVTICTNRLRELATVEHLKYRKYIKGEGSVGVNLCVCVKVKTSSRKWKETFTARIQIIIKILRPERDWRSFLAKAVSSKKKNFFLIFLLSFFCLFLKSRKIEQPSRWTRRSPSSPVSSFLPPLECFSHF